MCTRFVYNGKETIVGFNFDIDISEWEHTVIAEKDRFFIGIKMSDNKYHSFHGINRNGNVGTLLYVHGNDNAQFCGNESCYTIADLTENFIKGNLSFDDSLEIVKKKKITYAPDTTMQAMFSDRNGLHNVSLKAIAENLGIRTPSLYNHIGSLDELLREIAHSGMRTMNEKMIRAVIGKTGDSALKLVAVEYLNYMIEHPGVYEIIQWASWNGTEETAIIFNDYLSLLKTLICSCGFNPDKTTEILNMVTGMLHGYTTLQLRYAFSNPDKVRKELSEAIDTLLLGANQKYKD